MDVMLAAGVVPGKHIICRHIFLPLFGIGSANRPGLAHHPNAEEDLPMRIRPHRRSHIHTRTRPIGLERETPCGSRTTTPGLNDLVASTGAGEQRVKMMPPLFRSAGSGYPMRAPR